ncbi:hypothetical protein BCT94_05785 [Vibrio breoganii]|uniref:Uncharacterized protein n=1 Tax=Vibrio breoganii TaxID=553239 RepID=A0AAP8SY48_9VIBR|nr:hypothetical protein [Vibrio breoganii]PMK78596.1 hypothetical protein BCT94_05785 [Vibrio breoganii]PMP14071.1 hypothetical protein BCS93_04590 [Vibrio breoganii]
MLSIKFGDTGFSLLKTVNDKKQKMFVVFYNGAPVKVFDNEASAKSFIWAEYKRMLNIELTKEEEEQAKLAFFRSKEEESELVARMKYQLYLQSLKTPPTPTPKPTNSTFKPK